jgi:MYXO-CTERM domain-containing protein
MPPGEGEGEAAMVSLLLPLAFAGPHTVMVGVHDAASAAAVRRVTRTHGGTSRCWASGDLCILQFEGKTDLTALSHWPGIRYVEADRRIETEPVAHASPGAHPDPPTDPAPPGDADGTEDCPDLWELAAIGLPDAWATTGERGADSPVVAIQDAGFLLDHVDVVGHVSGGWDYGDGDSVPEVALAAGVPAHGTFIAGIVAATDDNDIARAGVLPEGRVNLQKIADSSGAMWFSYAIAAMLDLADGDLGVRVLNYSIASSSTTAAFNDAIAALGQADILLVAAAGNCSSANCWNADNDAYPLYPANSAGGHVLSVGGSQRDDALNPYSHFGANSVDLVAPGVDICSLGIQSTTDAYTAAGTSYASPIVAATAALVLGVWPDLTAVEVARVLRASADDIPALEGLVRSGGRLSASRAVATAVPRLDAPGDGFFSGRTALALDIENAAARGEGIVLLFHGAGLDIEGVSGIDGWTTTPIAVGDTLDLPDAGTVTASRIGTRLDGPLPAGTTSALLIDLAGRIEGDHLVTARLIASSEGADYLNTPYLSGTPDETGFLSWPFTLRVDAVASDDSGLVDSGDPDSGDLDSGDPDSGQPDSGDAGDGDPAPSDTAGCGCSSQPGAGWRAAFPLALLGLLVARRRRSLQ